MVLLSIFYRSTNIELFNRTRTLILLAVFNFCIFIYFLIINMEIYDIIMICRDWSKRIPKRPDNNILGVSTKSNIVNSDQRLPTSKNCFRKLLRDTNNYLGHGHEWLFNQMYQQHNIILLLISLMFCDGLCSTGRKPVYG